MTASHNPACCSEAALSRAASADSFPKLAAYKARMVARPAYQRALAKGGPVVMS